MGGFYELDLKVVHINSIHIALDKLSHVATCNFTGGWEMLARMCPRRREIGYNEDLTTFIYYLA